MMKSNSLIRLLAVLMTVAILALSAGCGIPGFNGFGQGSSTESYKVKDIQGYETELKHKPNKIVTLSLGTDTIMLGLVEPERMAAVNSLMDDPINSVIPEMGEKFQHKIGNPSAEELAALQPDLVIYPDWGDLTKVQYLRDMGIPVVVCKGAVTIDEVKDNIRLLAEAAGEKDRGEDIIRQMDEKLQENDQKVAKIPENQRKSVVLISVMKTFGGIGSMFDEICHRAGVINGRSAAGIGRGQTMSKEQLVKINPDILFLPTYNNHGKFDLDAFRKSYLDDPSLQTMKAIVNKDLREPREYYLYSDSQDVVFGVQEIDYMVYGDDFRLADRQHITAVPQN